MLIPPPFMFGQQTRASYITADERVCNAALPPLAPQSAPTSMTLSPTSPSSLAPPLGAFPVTGRVLQPKSRTSQHLLLDAQGPSAICAASSSASSHADSLFCCTPIPPCHAFSGVWKCGGNDREDWRVGDEGYSWGDDPRDEARNRIAPASTATCHQNSHSTSSRSRTRGKRGSSRMGMSPRKPTAQQ